MPARRYKPTTAGRRNSSVLTRDSVTREKPQKNLLRKIHKSGGRNNKGRITTRHIGGGHKRQYRLIDFKRVDKDGVPAKVAHIEYDPNRTSRIALLHYADGEKRYITNAPQAGIFTVMARTGEPGASLPCHFHEYDESITIVSGIGMRLSVAGMTLCQSIVLSAAIIMTAASARLATTAAMNSPPVAMTTTLLSTGANIGAANRRWAFSRPAATAPIP
jgi:uncharacterized MnhB-related membrane protein